MSQVQRFVTTPQKWDLKLSSLIVKAHHLVEIGVYRNSLHLPRLAPNPNKCIRSKHDATKTMAIPSSHLAENPWKV